LPAKHFTVLSAPWFPEYQQILVSASSVIVPGLVLAEVDYFLRENRRAMRRLIADIFDPATRYEYESPLPSDIARALELDAKFEDLSLGSVDGTVAAVAERRQVFRILTRDRRDFAGLRVGPRLNRSFHLLPQALLTVLFPTLPFTPRFPRSPRISAIRWISIPFNVLNAPR
jgi:uncharacterized protein